MGFSFSVSPRIRNCLMWSGAMSTILKSKTMTILLLITSTKNTCLTFLSWWSCYLGSFDQARQSGSNPFLFIIHFRFQQQLSHRARSWLHPDLHALLANCIWKKDGFHPGSPATIELSERLKTHYLLLSSLVKAKVLHPVTLKGWSWASRSFGFILSVWLLGSL